MGGIYGINEIYVDWEKIISSFFMDFSFFSSILQSENHRRHQRVNYGRSLLFPTILWHV
jgi:hypothetical protein